jgi:hypothetical protein
MAMISAFVLLHASIVAAYGGGSGESLAAVAVGVGVATSPLVMWLAGKPTNPGAQLLVTALLFAGYIGAFLVVG